MNFLFATYKLHLNITEVSKSVHCSQNFASSRIAELKFDQFNKDWSEAAAAASRYKSGGMWPNFPNLFGHIFTYLVFLSMFFCLPKCAVNRAAFCGRATVPVFGFYTLIFVSFRSA